MLLSFFDNVRFVARMRTHARVSARTCTWAQVSVSGRAVRASGRARFAHTLPFFTAIRFTLTKILSLRTVFLFNSVRFVAHASP